MNNLTSTSRCTKEITFPETINPEHDKHARQENVMRCMIYQLKKKGKYFKNEKFILAFKQSLTEVERDSKSHYLCFDYSRQATDTFIQQLYRNLSISELNHSKTTLGWVLANSLGFTSYGHLQLHLETYRMLLETPWCIDGERITKPKICSNMTGSTLSIDVPFRAVSDHSRASDYKQHHRSVAKIYRQENEPSVFYVDIPYIYLYKGEVFRSFSFNKEDALAWLMAFSIVNIDGPKCWNNELRIQRALARPVVSDKKWEQFAEKFLNI
ncbi:hypothetical protein K5N30_002942 [Vibrio parahaemolyticus]|nr:hypothetical protein [Vibrio parahaemolyticus]